MWGFFGMSIFDRAIATFTDVGLGPGGRVVTANDAAHLSIANSMLASVRLEDAATAAIAGGNVSGLWVSGGSATAHDAAIGTLNGFDQASVTGGTIDTLWGTGTFALDHVAVGAASVLGGAQLDAVDSDFASRVTAQQDAQIRLTRGTAGDVESVGDASSVTVDSATLTGVTRARGHGTVELVDTAAGALDAKDLARLHVLRGSATGYFSAADYATLDWEGAIGGAKAVQVTDFASFALRGGSISQLLGADAARLELRGGTIENALYLRGTAIASLTGGAIGFDADADQGATLLIKGGHVGRYLSARGDASVALFGTDFAVDGAPVSLGPLPVPHGIVTGTLASGEPIAVEFFHAGAQPPHLPGLATGTIRVPEPDAGFLALAASAALAVVAAARRKAR
jgi:hypothetical protein